MLDVPRTHTMMTDRKLLMSNQTLCAADTATTILHHSFPTATYNTPHLRCHTSSIIQKQVQNPAYVIQSQVANPAVLTTRYSTADSQHDCTIA